MDSAKNLAMLVLASRLLDSKAFAKWVEAVLPNHGQRRLVFSPIGLVLEISKTAHGWAIQQRKRFIPAQR